MGLALVVFRRFYRYRYRTMGIANGVLQNLPCYRLSHYCFTRDKGTTKCIHRKIKMHNNDAM